jgi:hypothetical protein
MTSEAQTSIVIRDATDDEMRAKADTIVVHIIETLVAD